MVETINKTTKFYILSPGRSGSTFLAQYIQKVGQITDNLHQTNSSRRINILSNIACNSKNLQIRLINRFNLIDKPKSTADPLHSVYLMHYFQNQGLTEDMRIIHLVRDPRDFISSFINYKNRKLSGVVAHHIIPFWMPNPLLTKEKRIIEYLFMPKYEHYAWIWKFKNEMFSKLSKYSDNYRVFRIEDITSDPGKMKELLDFIEIAYTNIDDELLSKKVTPSKINSFPKWKSWNERMAKNVFKHCNDQMKKYGYGNEPEWLELIK